MEVRGLSGKHIPGEMAEWLKAPVLKTGTQQCVVGSTPTLSARRLQPVNLRVCWLFTCPKSRLRIEVYPFRQAHFPEPAKYSQSTTSHPPILPLTDIPGEHRSECLANLPRFSSNELFKAPCSILQGALSCGASNNSLFFSLYKTPPYLCQNFCLIFGWEKGGKE